jgi:hypothetical protein
MKISELLNPPINPNKIDLEVLALSLNFWNRVKKGFIP